MSPRTFVTRGAALLAIASFGLAACESKTVVTPADIPISVTVTPAAVTLTAVNQTAQFVALVTGPAGTAGTVTWTSSTPGVASVDANGVVKALTNGTTSIIAQSTVDATKRAAGVVTVQIPPPVVVTPPATPTISIQSITTNAGTNVDLTNTFGQINVALNVDVPAGNTINSVNTQIDGTTVCSQTFTQGTQANVGTEGTNAVVIVCSVNTAALNATTGAPLYANGPHTITATLVGPGGTVKASTSTSIVFNNVSLLSIATPTFTKTATAANGQVWNGGAITVVVTPALFGTSPLTSITVTLTQGAAVVSKTQAVSGTGPQTFVFVDTAGSALKVAAPEGLTTITATSSTVSGVAGPSFPLVAPAQNPINVLIDEKPPAIGGAFTFPSCPAAPAVCAAPFWFNAASTLTLSSLGLTQADGGVNTDVVTLQSAPAATPTALTAVTTIAAIGQQSAGSTILKVTVCDALGNCASTTSPAFGVDLVAPVVSFIAPSPAANAINPATAYTLLITDTGSVSTVVSGVPAGAFKIMAKEFIPSGNLCLNVGTGVTTAPPSSGTCAPTAQGVAGSATYAFSLPATEAYDSIVVTAVDSAGNASSTVARFALVDTHAPAIAGITSPATILGGTSVAFGTNVSDNIDLKALTGVLAYTDLTKLTLAPATIDAFGLPETTTAAASLTVNPFVTSLQYTALAAGLGVPGGASVDANTITLTVTDQSGTANLATDTRSLALAGNIVTQVAFNWTAAPTNVSSFTLSGAVSPTTGVHPVTETLTVAAIVPTGQATPFSQVQFYEVTGAPAAGNLAPGSTLTLVGSAAGNTASISETVVQRTITYSAAVAIPTAGTHSYVVVGVDASGHGVVSNVIQVVVT